MKKKTHIRYKGGAMCGNKGASKFVRKNGDFDTLPPSEKCKNCERASSR